MRHHRRGSTVRAERRGRALAPARPNLASVTQRVMRELRHARERHVEVRQHASPGYQTPEEFVAAWCATSVAEAGASDAPDAS
jgi:hypothetical protein